MARVLSSLSWMTRQKIAQDVARGLVYLQEAMNPQLIFQAIKVPKVLLVEDFNAKLSDFRLFKQGPSQEVVFPSRQVNLPPNCSLKPWNFQLVQHNCHVFLLYHDNPSRWRPKSKMLQYPLSP